MNSPIHDHSGSHCIMKVLAGELTETQYHWPSKTNSHPFKSDSESDAEYLSSAGIVPTCSKMTVKRESVLKRNEVTYMHGKIHFFVIRQIKLACIVFQIKLLSQQFLCTCIRLHTIAARLLMKKRVLKEPLDVASFIHAEANCCK